jgi:D-alanine-D-alanine ligase
MRILLIVGGWSSEREVSLRGGQGIEKALRARGHEVTWFDLLEHFDQLSDIAAQHDFALINLHGAPGEDGLVQSLLERAGCPYQGSGPTGSFLALNKSAAKQVFRRAGLQTPQWEFLPQRPAAGWQPRLSYPIFAKSNTGGSSLHLAPAHNKAELDAILEEIFAAGDAALIENAICGKEVTCGVLGEEALPPILIEPVAGKFFDYTSKYAKGGAREICPAPLSPALTARVQALAVQAHKALGLHGYSRADFILTDEEELYLLEVNTLPGMTETSLVPQEAAVVGLSFGELLEKLIALGLQQHNKN